MSRRIYLVAAEASGDALGADLARRLTARAGGPALLGVDMPEMRRVGVEPRLKVQGLATLGLLDGLRALDRVGRMAEAVAADIVAAQVDAAVLIDSWGFSFRVARALRRMTPAPPLIVKYVGPQVWASRPARARQLAAVCDHLLCIFPFEVPFYRPYGLTCTVTGLPAVSVERSDGGAAWRARQGIDGSCTLMGVLFGSRPKELRRLGPVLEAALGAIHHARPDVRFLVVAAAEVEGLMRERAAGWAFPHRLVTQAEAGTNGFAAMDLALACSGTVTTELAMQATPVVAAYRLDWLTWAVARAGGFTAPFVSLVNIAANREVIPEFVQTRCVPRNLARACLTLIDSEDARWAQTAAQDDALVLLGRGQGAAADRAADALMAVIEERRPQR